jgi:TetR/AcrR family transcriptional regulator, regulator of biofilm formation and stress response
MSEAPNPVPARGHARNAILGAVVRIVTEDGIDAVTHRRVAAEAGVSPGSTTHHFTSREDLLRSALRFYLDRADRLLDRIADETRDATDDPLERVRTFVTRVIHEEFDDERLVRAEYELLLYASGDAQLASHVRAWEGRWAATIAGDLEAAGRPAPLETARALINFMRGYEIERLLDPRLSIVECRRRIDLLLAPPRSAERA